MSIPKDKLKLVAAIFLIIPLLAGCSQEETDMLQVYTTVYANELIVEQIVGDTMEVHNIYPEGSDLHNYKLSSQEVANIVDADLVIYTSELVETEIADIKATDTDDTVYLELFPNDEESEHYWVSPKQLQTTIEPITVELQKLAPENSSLYEENAQELATDLVAVDEQYQAFGEQQTTPLIVAHDAYHHLLTDYGIETISLSGKHHEDEIDAKEQAEIIELINEENINYIFVDQTDDQNETAKVIAEETGSSLATLHNLSTESSAITYASVVEYLEYNLQEMQKTLEVNND